MGVFCSELDSQTGAVFPQPPWRGVWRVVWAWLAPFLLAVLVAWVWGLLPLQLGRQRPHLPNQAHGFEHSPFHVSHAVLQLVCEL